MYKLVWDQPQEKKYETGVDQGVLYPYIDGAPGPGVAWNGLTSVSESPEGAEPTAIYADNIKYLTLRSVENFKGTIGAYMYPDEWMACDGSVEPVTGLSIGQQTRKMFGLSYRTKIGNDEEFDDYGYKIHMVYGATASPSEKEYNTINDSPEASELSWEFETNPVKIAGYKPCAHLIADSSKLTEAKMALLESVLYGIDTASIQEYSTTNTYNIGDMCKKTTAGSPANVAYYRCNTASTTGEWDSSKWDVISDTGPRLPMPADIITLLS